jgi:uncharacterized BrkB/YihY/UPF0761 family membrane protein
MVTPDFADAAGVIHATLHLLCQVSCATSAGFESFLDATKISRMTQRQQVNVERQEALKDLAALVSILIFVLGVGLGLFLVVFFGLAPSVLGPLDQPLPNGLWGAAAVLLTSSILFAVGGLMGGALWIIVMSRFLPKRTMHKWLTYGPQIRPILALNLRLLDRMYAGRSR